MTEISDVLDLLMGFQEHNSVQVEMRMSVVDAPGKQDLVITVLAHDKAAEIGGLPPLASVSVKCLGLSLRMLRDAVTHALYALDFQLALHELAEKEPKS